MQELPIVPKALIEDIKARIEKFMGLKINSELIEAVKSEAKAACHEYFQRVIGAEEYEPIFEATSSAILFGELTITFLRK